MRSKMNQKSLSQSMLCQRRWRFLESASAARTGCCEHAGRIISQSAQHDNATIGTADARRHGACVARLADEALSHNDWDAVMNRSAETIRKEMQCVRREIADDVQDVVESTRQMTDWHSYVNRYPLVCVGGGCRGISARSQASRDHVT